MPTTAGSRPTRPKVLVLYGTRPEAIKMAPVVRALRCRDDRVEPIVGTTGQHRDMVRQVHDVFGLRPDLDLDLMTPDQQLSDLAARVLRAVDEVLERISPDWLLVQGDTTTAMASALAAHHRGVRVGHVEAGLRTGHLRQPFPEEANRRLIDVLADALFAPTARAQQALLTEGHPPDRVHLTGNTVVDALHTVASKQHDVEPQDEVLVTMHRRESFGAPLRGMVAAIAELADRFPETWWTVPVHPNPNVRDVITEELADRANVRLTAPLPYVELVRCLMRVRLVLTDSGGIQEEAPSFGTPVLVLRGRTERPEGIDAGVAQLVGVSRGDIVRAATEVLTDSARHAMMGHRANPYGDGLAADRIAAILSGQPWEPFTPRAAVTPRRTGRP